MIPGKLASGITEDLLLNDAERLQREGLVRDYPVSTDPGTTTEKRGERRNFWPSLPGIGPVMQWGSSPALRGQN